jgi:hypothetical protein
MKNLRVMQKRKEDEKCVDRERNDATKKKNTRVMMKKRKGDEKRGRMKKKDEKQETRHIFRNMQILRTRQVRRTTSRSTRTVKRVGYGVSTGGREKGGEGGAPWMCVRRSVAYMNEYLLGLPTFFFFFTFFACN